MPSVEALRTLRGAVHDLSQVQGAPYLSPDCQADAAQFVACYHPIARRTSATLDPEQSTPDRSAQSRSVGPRWSPRPRRLQGMQEACRSRLMHLHRPNHGARVALGRTLVTDCDACMLLGLTRGSEESMSEYKARTAASTLPHALPPLTCRPAPTSYES
jgi:hypothetical protein